MIPFTKMHGNGNDFVIIDEYKELKVPEEDKSRFVKAICDRRFGIGADGVIFVQRSSIADVKFRYFNSDGSEAEMCGNGIRCFARYIVEEGYTSRKPRIETLAGVIEVEVMDGWWVRVRMNKPRVTDIWGYDYKGYKLYHVNVGVPHVVIFVDSLNFDIIPIARDIRYADIFPNGTNVNFVRVLNEEEIEIRTYERGVEDETLSCGTGSIASAFVANRLNLVKDIVTVKTRGGILKVELGERVYLIGPAKRVFDGVIREL